VKAAAAIAAAVVASGAAGAATPNPCSLVPGATVASTLGLKGVTLSGKLSTRPDGKVKQSVCTYTNGKTSVQIDVAPHQPSGGSGGPPGMVRGVVSGLGPGAMFFYGTNPHFLFASVSFTKGGYDVGVYNNGTVPHQDVPLLAKLVYAAIG
jgi:hypothetical protein